MAEYKRHQGHRQRMRERVQNYGLDSLAEHEALEYVLYLTNAQKDTNGIAHDLIDRFGDFAAVLEASEEELCTVEGVGPATARMLHLLPQICRYYSRIVEAPKNRNLKDAFTRVAADPKTKLSRDNRFVGPALLCMKHHILPFYLAKGIAYGFLYRDESDIASIEITNYVKEHGIEKAIEVYCGLTENEWELKQLIMAQYKEAEKIR